MSRRRHKRPEEQLAPVLPITPMLDMAFQIFAFFVVTYNPSGLEGQMELNLPALGEVKAEKQEDVDPKSSDVDVALPAEVTVVAKTVHDGVNDGIVFSGFNVELPAGPTQLNTQDPRALTEHLKKIQSTLQNKEDIKLQCDRKLKWNRVIEVMDACRKAGFKNIGFGPPVD
jgi:biopolymer transport protein ExbD